MKSKCIAVRSVTYAQKAQDVLKRNGISASAVRRTEYTERGCGWCVKVPYTQAQKAYILLQNNGVSVTGDLYDIP